MEAVLKRLATLGYEVEDLEGVLWACSTTEDEVKAELGCESIPPELDGYLVDRAVRHFLALRGVKDVRLGDLALELTAETATLARFRKVVW